ncbi:MAG: short-chain dehydrogenase/reductase [Actinomycetia bacterium]|nr:short-chain dehydrogenase/reductase [Actinomycetes bacterium]
MRDVAVAVVTGASRGLGAGLAEAFAAAGLQLGLCARTDPAMPDGPDVVARRVDVTDADAVERFAAEVHERLGPIDLWVNNAGTLGPVDPVRSADPGQVATNLAVNVLGVVHGTQAFLRHLGPTPVLVNVSSGAASKAYAGWGAYCASKAAVERFTDVVALEEPGLRAYAVAPGVVDTDMQAEIRSTPADRFPTVERFHDLKARDAFNSQAWVAGQLLELAFGDVRPPTSWRIPDEP